MNVICYAVTRRTFGLFLATFLLVLAPSLGSPCNAQFWVRPWLQIHAEEAVRDPEALTVLAKIATAMNPQGFTTLGTVTTIGQLKQGGSTALFTEISSGLSSTTYVAGGVDKPLLAYTVNPFTLSLTLSDGTTSLVGDQRLLERQPTLPVFLVQAAATDPRIGVGFGNKAGAGSARDLLLYLHTGAWRSDMGPGQTLVVELHYDPSSYLVSCERMTSQIDDNPRHTQIRTLCYGDYRQDQGWVLPHTLSDIRGGRLWSSSLISSLVLNVSEPQLGR